VPGIPARNLSKSGQLEEARALLPRSLAEAQERGSLEYEGMARANQAWVALRDGDLNEAQANARAALELWQPPVDIRFKSLVLWPLIGVRLAKNQMAEAIEAAQDMLAPDQQPLPEALAAVVKKAIRFWETEDEALARANLDQAVELARGHGYL
jgi:tetratricopeptide (TPR) repeat protein